MAMKDRSHAATKQKCSWPFRGMQAKLRFGMALASILYQHAADLPDCCVTNAADPTGWTPDGKVITSPGLSGQSIGVRDPVTSSFTKIVAHPTQATTAPDLSRDGKWLTFHTVERESRSKRLENRRQILVAPYTGQWAPPDSWIPITDGTALDREPRWSADGNRIYFLSDRDGFRCIWARKLDSTTKRPLESIYPVLHLHGSHLSLLHIPNTGNVSICPVRDKLIFAMGEISGNIWMMDLHQK